jgi:hypothetical protein
MEKSRIEKLQHHFRHFATRLYERHNILITFEEYVYYCNLPEIKDSIRLEREDGKISMKGVLKIKGKRIIVYRQLYRPRALLTTLPME